MNPSPFYGVTPPCPAVGTVTLATLLTEAGEPLARRDHAALRTLSGVAPVTKRSGKTCIVVMRYAAQVRLRQAVFHWARVAVVHDPESRGRYEALRARGRSYGRALRGVADRLLGVACVLLRGRCCSIPITAAQRRRDPNPILRLE